MISQEGVLALAPLKNALLMSSSAPLGDAYIMIIRIAIPTIPASQAAGDVMARWTAQMGVTKLFAVSE